MNYPLSLSFKIIALSPQATVRDADGNIICHMKQKIFRLREKVEVYADVKKTELVATIQANKILDWSARYTFRDGEGNEIGSVGRQGMRSIWKAHYDVFNPGDNVPDFNIREENPFAKVIDSFVGQIPIIGLCSAFFFHPSYLASRSANEVASMRLKKMPAFLEGKFEITKEGDLSQHEEMALILSFIMLNLLERRRG